MHFFLSIFVYNRGYTENKREKIKQETCLHGEKKRNAHIKAYIYTHSLYCNDTQG